jgi:hypothetical protein
MLDAPTQEAFFCNSDLRIGFPITICITYDLTSIFKQRFRLPGLPCRDRHALPFYTLPAATTGTETALQPFRGCPPTGQPAAISYLL